MNGTADITIVEARRGRIAVLRVEGRLDAPGVTALIRSCEEAEVAGRNLVLDLSGVTFLASSGVGAMLVLAERCRGRGVAVRYAAPSDAVLAVIALLNLRRHLEIDLTEEAAIAALEAGR